jgi:hypothetical protein
MKMFLLLSFFIAGVASAQTTQPIQTVQRAQNCLLNQVYSVSPLKEDLNYTKGSGRGYDVIIEDNGNHSARLGNLDYSTKIGDTINSTQLNNGTMVYGLSKYGSLVHFQLVVYPDTQNGGKYGPVQSGQFPAQLGYQIGSAKTGMTGSVIRAASLTCY